MLKDVGGIWAFAAVTIGAKFEDGGMVFVGVANTIQDNTIQDKD